jgi:hypothetical protein
MIEIKSELDPSKKKLSLLELMPSTANINSAKAVIPYGMDMCYKVFDYKYLNN